MSEKTFVLHSMAKKNEQLQAELERVRNIMYERGATIEMLSGKISSFDEITDGMSNAISVLEEENERLQAELDATQELLKGLYGTVRGTAKWERRWPNISAMVKDAIGKWQARHE